MRHRLLSILLPVCMGLLPYHASALDCQSPTRADLRTICRDPALKAADERHLALYERICVGLPVTERSAFAAYENGWVSARSGRCPVRDGETDKAFSQSIDPNTTNTWQDTIDVRTTASTR